MEKLNRRSFLRAAALSAAGIAAVACQPQTVIVKETVQVKEEVTRIVAGTPVVEKVVETKEVVKEVTKVVQQTVEVKVTVAAQEIREAPDLFAQAAQGKIPPLAERLPTEPLPMEVVDEIGTYGGTWRRVAVGPNDVGIINSRLSYVDPVRYTAMGVEIVPFVAKGWEVGADGAEFTFQMRKGMKWSDGQPYTADDIMFWYDDIQNNTELTVAISAWLKIKGEPVTVSKVDDYTIKFKFADSYGLFIPIMASPNGYDLFANRPKHYLSQFHAKYAKKEDLDKAIKDRKFETWWTLFNDRWGWLNVDCPRVWPWQMTKAPPDVPAVAERNAYFFCVDPLGSQLPYIDRLRFEVVENIDILNTKAIAGAVDCQFRHISWVNYPLYMDNAKKGDYQVFKWTLAEGSNCCLHFNLNHEDKGLRELEENKQFRQALSMAIDRAEINEVVYQGLGTPRQASVLPVVPYFKQSQADAYAQYDPAGANKLLDGIGLTKRDGEGMRLRLDGKPLTITIEYAPVFGPWADVLQMVSKYWKAIGVRATPKEEARPLFSERGDAGTVQDMSVWTMDRSAHFLIEPLYQMPRRGGTPASVGALYWDWYTSGGKQGEEPPPEVKKAYELYESCKTAKNAEELARYATELLDLNAEQVWFIGIVGLLPHVGIVKTNFHNVPKEAVSDWLCLTPGNTNIEQYFFRED